MFHRLKSGRGERHIAVRGDSSSQKRPISVPSSIEPWNIDDSLRRPFRQGSDCLGLLAATARAHSNGVACSHRQKPVKAERNCRSRASLGCSGRWARSTQVGRLISMCCYAHGILLIVAAGFPIELPR